MTDEQLALLCQRAQHIVRHQAQAAPSNEGPMMAVVLQRLIADHAEPIARQRQLAQEIIGLNDHGSTDEAYDALERVAELAVELAKLVAS